MPRLAAALLLGGCFSVLLGGCRMALSKELYLFSETEGVVLQNDRPVAGAEVERTYNWHWKDKIGSEATRTDEQGRFRFPAATGSSLLGVLLPHEPVVVQKIHIRHQGKVYEAWMYTKHNYEPNGELDGQPLRLVCRLDSPPTYRDKVYGICTIE